MLAEVNFMTCIVSNSPPDVFLGKGVLKACSKYTAEYPCRSVISIKLIFNFIEVTLCHGRSPVNLMHIFRTSFPKSSTGGLLSYCQFLNIETFCLKI